MEQSSPLHPRHRSGPCISLRSWVPFACWVRREHAALPDLVGCIGASEGLLCPACKQDAALRRQAVILLVPSKDGE